MFLFVEFGLHPAARFRDHAIVIGIKLLRRLIVERVLVCVPGNTRAPELTFPSFKRQVLDELSAAFLRKVLPIQSSFVRCFMACFLSEAIEFLKLMRRSHH